MAEYRGKKSRKPSNQPGIEQVVVEAVFKGIWSLITLPFRGKRGGTKSSRIAPAVAAQLSSHWSSIESHLGSTATLALAVSEADKLLDAAMQAAAIPGQNMGERLKQARTVFSGGVYQSIWDAHKLRNSLAHEVGTALSYQQAAQAVSTFRTALQEIGVPV